MSEYRIKVTPQATEQLYIIRKYIEQELKSPLAAKNLLRLMKQKLTQLAVMPQSYQTIDEEPWGSQGVRKISVKNYYIYYWIDEEQNEVHILAIIYNKRDQNQQLLELLD